MIQSKEEVKLFESKFKGSLEKLDDFEKKWSDFKVTHVAPVLSSSASKQAEKEYSMRIDFIGKINSSFDAGLSS